MTEPTLIRFESGRNKTIVRVRMVHEMESGQRKDAAGKLRPAWFIQEVQVKLNGQTVLSTELGPSVSKNPFLQLSLKAAKTGDKLAVSWQDNRGVRRTDEAVVP